MDSKDLNKNRRSFLKKAGLGGLGLGLMVNYPLEEQIELPHPDP